MNKLLHIILLYIMVSCRDNSQVGKTYAVVVGISDYKNLNSINGDLLNADKDAQRFSKFLRGKKGGDVPTSNMVMLLNKDATKVNILKALNIFANTTENDKVWFYFSGHGISHGIVPYDVVGTKLSTILGYSELKKKIKLSKATTKICIIDACESGSIKSKTKIIDGKKQISLKNDSNVNVAMILAARSNQSAIENNSVAGGIFTYFLLKGLNGEANFDKNNTITIRELFKYVSPQVKKNTINHQSPVFTGRFSDNLVMAELH